MLYKRKRKYLYSFVVACAASSVTYERKRARLWIAAIPSRTRPDFRPSRSVSVTSCMTSGATFFAPDLDNTADSAAGRFCTRDTITAIEFTLVFVALREMGAIILALRVTLEICGNTSPRVILPTHSLFGSIVLLQVPLILEQSLTICTSKRERLRDTRRHSMLHERCCSLPHPYTEKRYGSNYSLNSQLGQHDVQAQHNDTAKFRHKLASRPHVDS